MVIDPSTEIGAKVSARLRDELVAWLVTVAADGTPAPTPVWSWWDGETILVYSQAGKPKLRHIAASIATNPGFRRASASRARAASVPGPGVLR